MFVGGGTGNVIALDATSGARIWQQSFGNTRYSCGTGTSTSYFGVQGTFVYDPDSQSLYVPTNANAMIDGTAETSIVRLSAATGTPLGRIDLGANALAGELNFTHTALALASGRLYLGTSSTCDISSWRGRVASADANLSNAQTFFTVWSSASPVSGGGVWGEGGVAIDGAGAVYTGVGNADTNGGASGPQPPFVQNTNEHAGYGDRFLKLGADLSYAASNVPDATTGDRDLTGSPVLYTPLACNDALASLQGKDGLLITYDTQGISQGPVAEIRLSPSTGDAPYLGNPGYSPTTGLLYASVETASTGLVSPGLLAYRPIGCGGSTSLALAWSATFGPDSYAAGASEPRSGVTVTAGGVVFVGTPCNPNGAGGCNPTISGPGGALWAIDASNGTVLNGGKPIVITGDVIRMAPIVDGNWVFVVDNSANLFAFTTDSSVPAKAAVRTFANLRFPPIRRLRHR